MQQNPSRRARRTQSPRMHNVTVHEKRKVNEEQPNPAAAHHTITTVHRSNNICSSALVLSRSTQFMARPSCWPQRRSPETGLHFCYFREFFCSDNYNKYTFKVTKTWFLSINTCHINVKLGKGMNIAFLQICADIKPNAAVVRDKIDPSYMFCGKPFPTRLYITTTPSSPKTLETHTSCSQY